MDWRGNQKRKSANRSDYCLGRLGMPGVLPMEICHIYHAIMSLTMHLRRWLGIPRDGITGIVMQGIYNVAPIRSIFHRAPPTNLELVSILERLLLRSLKGWKKKKEKKVVSAVGKKLSAHEARILLWKYTERYFRVGADFRKFRKHDKTPGGVVILGKWLSRVCYVPIAITSTPPCHYRIITASSIKPFHRVNGHEPLDIDV